MASKIMSFLFAFFLLILIFKIPVVLEIMICLTVFENYIDQKRKHVHEKL